MQDNLKGRPGLSVLCKLRLLLNQHLSLKKIRPEPQNLIVPNVHNKGEAAEALKSIN